MLFQWFYSAYSKKGWIHLGWGAGPGRQTHLLAGQRELPDITYIFSRHRPPLWVFRAFLLLLLPWQSFGEGSVCVEPLSGAALGAGMLWEAQDWLVGAISHQQAALVAGFFLLCTVEKSNFDITFYDYCY